MYDVRCWPAILTVPHASKKIVSVEFRSWSIMQIFFRPKFNGQKIAQSLQRHLVGDQIAMFVSPLLHLNVAASCCAVADGITCARANFHYCQLCSTSGQSNNSLWAITGP
uniref:Uncharacterized protein n=1 Tax=Romanomermis culicivorax TaxID=13658 RepID=A0A915KJM0_ROMCU